MIKSYELEGFEGIFERDEPEDGFVPLFLDEIEEKEEPKEEEKKEKPQEEVKKDEIDIEAQARKIFEDAYIAGEKAGVEMGMRKVEPLVKRLNQYLDELSDFKEELIKRAENLAFELAFLFAEAIILKKCEEERGIILNMIRKALEICEEKSNITVRVRGDDLKYLDHERIRHLNFVADDTLDGPGFVIETNFGDIDGRIKTQIEEMKRALIL
ncbi:MAG: FliH/SctL family protein [Syntrophorhabdaceae bacterium]|nr:FliH/SctL family protein [Syntrophorhabdaceae bacterium]